MEQHNKPVCELLCIDFCNKYEEQKSTIRELEARIAALTKDAEPVAIVEGLINFDGRFALSYGAKVKVGDKLYTHPPAPELKPLSLDEIHQRYKNLRVNEPPHYIDIYRDAEAALGILRGGL